MTTTRFSFRLRLLGVRVTLGLVRYASIREEARNATEPKDHPTSEKEEKVVDRDDIGYCEDRERDTHQVQGW